MPPHNDEHTPKVRPGPGASGLLAGVLLGSLVGAGTMLLLAPRSGKKTRAKLQRATITLRDEAVAGFEDAAAQTRAKAAQVAADLRQKAEKIRRAGEAS